MRTRDISVICSTKINVKKCIFIEQIFNETVLGKVSYFIVPIHIKFQQ